MTQNRDSSSANYLAADFLPGNAMRRLILSLAALCWMELSVAGADEPSAAVSQVDAQYFREQIEPLLREHCYACHSHEADSMEGGLALDVRSGWAAGGDRGPAIVPGRSSESLLVRAVRRADDDLQMPPDEPLPAEQVARLVRWIDRGAPDPRNAAPPSRKASTDWWSLRPLVRPEVPDRPAGEFASPIDRFLQQRLAEEGLAPAPRAERRTLIRRLYFDLHGLPPTPEQVATFLADPDPHAFEKLVDNLLDSPRYGERWARHWLDTVHFADSHGCEHDLFRPHAYRYRDYVVGSLNRDTPWDQFIRQQLAADWFYPDQPHLTAALGFIAAGPLELSRAGTAPVTFDYLDRDDIVTQTMAALASSTANCARCHDHKFDPITQEDYYALQAVFAGGGKGDVAYDVDPAAAAERRRCRQLLVAAESKYPALLRTPEVVRVAAEWEAARVAHEHDAEHAAGRPLPTAVEAAVSLPAHLRTFNQQASIAAYALERHVQQRLAELPAEEVVYGWSTHYSHGKKLAAAAQPKPVHVLRRGNIASPGEAAAPGALSAIATLPARFELADPGDEASRRAALANWLASPENPLTWRSIVNRVWSYHFGRGICDTPNDLGRMGGEPSHPDLLDWLAVWFRDDAKGSLKQLHRAILLSAAWQQTSHVRSNHALAVDAENRLLWKMTARPLDAEAYRDAVLQTSGRLDLTMGGPGIQQFALEERGESQTPALDYEAYDWRQPEAARRSIYRVVWRGISDPFMESLDFPDLGILAPKRGTSISPLQALTLYNNPFVLHHCQVLAERLESSRETRADQISYGFRLILLRDPTTEEITRLSDYVSDYGLAAMCRVLLNSNEFLFVD